MKKYGGCDHRGDKCFCMRLCGIRECNNGAYRRIPGTRKWRCKVHLIGEPMPQKRLSLSDLVKRPNLSTTERKLRDVQRQLTRLIARVNNMEVVMTAWLTGKVEIQGVMHLMECDKRNNKKNACTCGAVPLGSRSSQKKG